MTVRKDQVETNNFKIVKLDSWGNGYNLPQFPDKYTYTTTSGFCSIFAKDTKIGFRV